MVQSHDLRFTPVHPVVPVAPYMGGKRQLSAKLVDMIERVPHITYAEPFVGMGGVFLRRRFAPKAEAINDISGDVTNFFRVLQRHYAPFMDLLKFQFTSRREFERLLATDPLTLTDMERAVRFLYLQRLSFGGKVRGRVFGVSASYPARFDVTKLGPMLTDLNERLSSVVIENLHYQAFIERYDTPETLFYLDPPYFGCENDYGKDIFSKDDFSILASILANIKGTFILSLNDTPEVRSVFSAFSLKEVELTYTINDGLPKAVTELIITPQKLVLRPEPQANLFIPD